MWPLLWMEWQEILHEVGHPHLAWIRIWHGSASGTEQPRTHPIRLRTSSTFPPEYASGIKTDLKPDWNTEDKTHSQLWRIQHTVAEITPCSTSLEQLDHTANPPWHQQVDPTRISVYIPRQAAAEAHINLTNNLVNNPQHLLLYTDGSQKKNGSNGSNGVGLVAIHARHNQQEKKWSLGNHVEVYDTELYGILQAADYARRWIARDPRARARDKYHLDICGQPSSHPKVPLSSCNSRTAPYHSNNRQPHQKYPPGTTRY